MLAEGKGCVFISHVEHMHFCGEREQMSNCFFSIHFHFIVVSPMLCAVLSFLNVTACSTQETLGVFWVAFFKMSIIVLKSRNGFRGNPCVVVCSTLKIHDFLYKKLFFWKLSKVISFENLYFHLIFICMLCRLMIGLETQERF